MMRWSRPGVLLGATILFLAGCADWNFGDSYREDFHFSYAVDPGARVEVENSNGGIEIDGWDQNTVEIEGTKYANTQERLNECRIDVTHSSSLITVRTARPPDGWGSCGARYIIRVPRRVDLSRIVSSNGAISVDGIEGGANLKTSNGSIQVSGIAGDASLQTTNGSIHADLDKGGFEAVTTNGSITARVAGADSSPVRLHSSNGHIELTMEAPREVRAETSNSSITVRMPASAGASIHARTSNSSISSDFDVTAHGILSKHRLEGTIGAGGPLLDLETSNGAIRIVRL